MKTLIIQFLDDFDDYDEDDDLVEGGGLGRTGGSRVIALGDGSRGTATPLTPTKK